MIILDVFVGRNVRVDWFTFLCNISYGLQLDKFTRC